MSCKYDHDYPVWCYQEIEECHTHNKADYCPSCGSPLSDPTPLTLEELRGMLDEWVWVELFRDGKCIYCGYGYIIQATPLSARILPENPGYATESDFLKGNAKFYTHKPKDGEGEG